MKNCRLPYLVVCLLLAAIINSPSEPATTDSTTNRFEENVDIGGRKLHLAIYGSGAPTVIVEAGLGEPAVESGTWKKVMEEVAKTTRICVYDRAGLGKSDAVTNALRTGQDIVQDLHTLLVNAKIAPPYILVGHSFGGFTARLYASSYPTEVAGVVLVDSSYPDQWSKLLAVLPPESSQETESIKQMRNFFADPKNNPERLDLVTTGKEVSAADDFGDKPLIVLSHSHDWRMYPSLPKDVSDRMEQLWEEWQNDLCRLSTQSSHKVAAKAGHYIHSEEPRLVSDAILKIVSATKEQAR